MNMKAGQNVKIIKVPKDCQYTVSVGDFAVECGYDGHDKMHEFHSTYLVDQVKRGNNYLSESRGVSYWVEFLPDDCVELV